MGKLFFFASLKSMKKGVGSISQRYGSVDPDPDPHQNVTDPQRCFVHLQTEDRDPDPTYGSGSVTPNYFPHQNVKMNGTSVTSKKCLQEDGRR